MDDKEPESADLQKEMGVQPLDTVMSGMDLKNHDLVGASTEQLTHKMVSKARKGRRITLNVKMKILNAVNKCQNRKQFALKDLFNY